MKMIFVFGIVISNLMGSVPVYAQETLENSPAVQDYVSTARELAGERYSNAMERLCAAREARARPSFPNPTVEPLRVFDNLYFLGLPNVYAWAVNTPEGIILLDSLTAPDVEPTIIEGMRKVGLDPSRVRYVVISHSHLDHYGGASYFQTRYDAEVLASEADWELIEEQSESQPDRLDGGPPLVRNIVVSDGQTLSLGGTTLTFVATPGHTPGALSVIIPVTDQGQAHVVAFLNGPRITSLETARQMTASTERLATIAKAAHVDVEINNHSYIDDSLPIIEATRERQPGTPHPFVIGEEGFQQFTGWMVACLKADIVRLER
jgi:metallo-beta-lactamase class B